MRRSDGRRSGSLAGVVVAGCAGGGGGGEEELMEVRALALGEEKKEKDEVKKD